MSTTLLPVSDVAKELRTSKRTVYRLLENGYLPYVDVDASGRRPRMRVAADDLARFIAARTTRA